MKKVTWFLFAVWLMLMIVPAIADDECRGHSCNGNGDVGVDVGVSNDISVTTPVSVESGSSVSTDVSHSSRAYAVGLGDVDINQCYRSFQILVGQGSQLNFWCVSESLDAQGLHDAAAKARCNIDSYRKLFEDRDECVRQSTMRPAPIEAMADIDDDEEEYHRELQHEVAMLRSDLQAKIENLEEQRVPILTEKQRMALQEVLGE